MMCSRTDDKQSRERSNTTRKNGENCLIQKSEMDMVCDVGFLRYLGLENQNGRIA